MAVVSALWSVRVELVMHATLTYLVAQEARCEGIIPQARRYHG